MALTFDNTFVQSGGSPQSVATDVRTIVKSSAPRPLLSRKAESRLSTRHHEVLEQLDDLFMQNGFASFTITDLVREAGCSRRTLYEIAPSKEQLVLIVLDRRLHRMGRAALHSIDPLAPLGNQIRQYIEGGVGYQLFAPMVDDLADEAPARRLVDRHYRFVMTVVQKLVRLGIDRGEFAEVDPAIVASVVTGSSLYFMQSAVSEDTGLDLSALVSGMLDLVLGGLPHSTSV